MIKYIQFYLINPDSNTTIFSDKLALEKKHTQIVIIYNIYVLYGCNIVDLDLWC